MKVARKEKARRDDWFDAGEIATVLMLTVSGTGGSQYLLWSKSEASIGFFAARDFEIIDDALPADWTANLDVNGNVVLCPPEWAAPRFWDDYHEGKFAAVEAFARWREILEDSAR